MRLKVKDRGFHGLLLVTRQYSKAVGEGVGNSEIHLKFPPWLLPQPHSRQQCKGPRQPLVP